MNDDIQVCPKCKSPTGYVHKYLFSIFRTFGRPDVMSCKCGYAGFAIWMSPEEVKEIKKSSGNSKIY